MLFRKTFRVRLNVPSPVQFASDADRAALLKVKENYEGKCFMGVYIADVVKITRRSKITMLQVGEISAGSISVQFDALCSSISVGDGYPAVQVKRGEQQILMGRGVGACAEKEPIVVTVLNANDAISDDSVVPVRVVSIIDYTPSKSAPTAMVELLTCRTRAAAWKVAGDADPQSLESAIQLLGPMLDDATEKLAAIKKVKNLASSRGFFSKLLHTYANPPEFKDSFVPLTSAKDVQAWASKLKAGSVWVRPLEAEYDFAGVVSAQQSDDAQATNASATAVLTAIVTEVVQAVALLNNIAEHYQDMEMLKRQLKVWGIMRHSQRSN